MASKFLSSLKDKRNNKNKEANEDELAIVKAAAWAWYQHGSGSEGKGMSEFDVSRTQQRTPRPSRYKLEAMRMTNNNNNNHQEEEEEETKDHLYHDEDEGSSISSTIIQNQRKNSLLLDAYEVQSISRQIGSIIESNANNNTRTSLDSGRRMVKKKDKDKTKKKGFWLRHVVVCGRGEDVVDSSVSSSSLRDHHRKSSKHIPSINLVK